jgi:Immunity protein 35
MEYQVAKNLVHHFINNRYNSNDDELVIIEDNIIETEFGWVFPYNSRRYLKTKKLTDALVGNSPIIFDNRDESIHVTGSSRPPSFYIDKHRENYIPIQKS